MRIVRYSAQILKGSGQQTGAFFLCRRICIPAVIQ